MPGNRKQERSPIVSGLLGTSAAPPPPPVKPAVDIIITSEKGSKIGCTNDIEQSSPQPSAGNQTSG